MLTNQHMLALKNIEREQEVRDEKPLLGLCACQPGYERVRIGFNSRATSSYGHIVALRSDSGYFYRLSGLL